MGMVAIFVMWPNSLYKFSFAFSHKLSYEIWFQTTQLFLRTRLNMGVSSLQGQVTLWLIVQYGRKPHMFKILYLSCIPASLKKLQLKLTVLCPGQGQKWFFLHSRASNSKAYCTYRPKFELVQNFTLVLNTCMFEEVAIKSEGTMPRTR